MRTSEFKKYHPIVNFIYFAFVIGFSMIFMHPVCLAISLICGFIYSAMLKGKKSVKKNLIYMMIMFVVMAIINPAVNHAGITILVYLPNGNPLTLESMIYGVSAAAMIVSVIYHFSCFNEIITSDKIIYLFGKLMPSLSLVFSMTLRFVPRFIKQIKEIADAQRGIGRDVSGGSIVKRAKCGLSILSIMLNRSLENALETADSMKSRGYGMKGRTAFSIYTLDRRDMKAIFCILIIGIYVIIGGINGRMDFRYFPSIKGVEPTIYSLSVFGAYLVLCLMPIIIESWEEIKWQYIKSKI